MNKSALEILACPIDKHDPLELYELQTEGDEIHEGVLFCSKCSRYFPIMGEIAVMLPDELRKKDEDLEFLQKWKGRIPDKVIKQGNPWHL
ncbi:MAG TPA: Trm112 family protein [Nitrososphaera sp.]|nr:Trm112 family protein [Nitrososphaera sp.]